MTKILQSEPTFLSRDAILAFQDIETRDVYVDEWRTTVRVRSITAGERERLLKGSVVVEGKVKRFDLPQMRVGIVALSVVNPDGSRMFSDLDAKALGQKNPKAIDRIADVALKMAGIDEDEEGTDETPLPTTPSASSSSS